MIIKKRIAWNKKYPNFWKCEECGKEFKNKTGHIRKFCSHNCHVIAQKKGKYLKGLFQSGTEHPGYKGIKYLCIDCGKPTKKQKGIKRCRSCFNIWERGENAPNWQGGIANYPYPPEFRMLREKIRERDNYQCRICGVPQKECFKKLHIHHIDKNKDNTNINNLISLCSSCHTKLHWKRVELNVSL